MPTKTPTRKTTAKAPAQGAPTADAQDGLDAIDVSAPSSGTSSFLVHPDDAGTEPREIARDEFGRSFAPGIAH